MHSLGSSNPEPAVLVLGTGGTIAGVAADPARASRYTAAQLGVAELVAAVPTLAGVPLKAEQVAQLDSKDMAPAVWRRLAWRIDAALADPAIGAVVITHGTDTLEETGYLLSRLFDGAKPVVLTAAMRPANAPDADGPRNLADAVTVARSAGARGVLAVLHQRVWAAAQLRKCHTHAIDAFGSAQAPPLGELRDGRLVMAHPWPVGQPWRSPTGERLGAAALPEAHWPRVEIVTSHAGADGRIVDLLVADGVHGLVVAGTGHGTVHQALEAALQRAQAADVHVRVASRVGRGSVSPRETLRWPTAGELSPAQARVALMLELLALAA